MQRDFFKLLQCCGKVIEVFAPIGSKDGIFSVWEIDFLGQLQGEKPDVWIYVDQEVCLKRRWPPSDQLWLVVRLALSSDQVPWIYIKWIYMPNRMIFFLKSSKLASMKYITNVHWMHEITWSRHSKQCSHPWNPHGFLPKIWSWNTLRTRSISWLWEKVKWQSY